MLFCNPSLRILGEHCLLWYSTQLGRVSRNRPPWNHCLQCSNRWCVERCHLSYTGPWSLSCWYILGKVQDRSYLYNFLRCCKCRHHLHTVLINPLPLCVPCYVHNNCLQIGLAHNYRLCCHTIPTACHMWRRFLPSCNRVSVFCALWFIVPHFHWYGGRQVSFTSPRSGSIQWCKPRRE